MKILYFNEIYIRSDHIFHDQMETFSALLAICVGNSPVNGEFPAQRPVTLSFDVFSDLRLNKRLSKQWWGWCLNTQSGPLWRQRNVENYDYIYDMINQCIYMELIIFKYHFNII